MDHDRFDWDDANIVHIAEHDVTPEEAEYALDNNPYKIDSRSEMGRSVVLRSARLRLGVFWF